MNQYIIRNYIMKLNKEHIYNFALKQNVTLTNNECKLILTTIQNEWYELLYGDASKIFNSVKDKFNHNTYNTMIKLYNEYKTKYQSLL